ncbi:MAG TPA: ATP-binding protein [Spirochaetia bacterium]|nr:ATP-binding protein [Spirochaetia bacterium]
MQIVTNLKNFARIDVEENFDLYDINAGIESSIVVAWNELKYVADVRKELGEVPQIRARGGEINQVILNIIVNAAQAIASQERTQKGTIVIRTYVKGENVVCSIEDNGPGIPESIRLRIFDPFFTTKSPGKGTGLGLSISYDIIVNKHSGSLIVDSEPGKGTIFTFELPISRIPSLPSAE